MYLLSILLFCFSVLLSWSCCVSLKIARPLIPGLLTSQANLTLARSWGGPEIARRARQDSRPVRGHRLDVSRRRSYGSEAQRLPRRYCIAWACRLVYVVYLNVFLHPPRAGGPSCCNDPTHGAKR
jgi:hypothetical protein